MIELEDTESLRTSLPSISPRHSLTSSSMTSFPDQDDEPPPYSAIDVPHHTALQQTPQWSSRDPRSSSTQSLVPVEADNNGRRKLLLIYVHGFMGDETSFQSFPAHVHNLVSVLLAESHVVHTKLYPRYRSKKAILVATEDFSTWLTPHESTYNDVILLSHSMGGLLAAEVALLAPQNQPSTRALRHRITGTINFDVPFLGMHPGVIKSGISSIFNPAPAQTKSPQHSFQQGASSSNLNDPLTSPPTDPYYNPAFPNDVRLPIRSTWSNAFHFVNKHSKNLRQATKQLVTSHLEFGGAMADFEGLKVRYCRIRLLENDDPKLRKTVVDTSAIPPRVRFVNYYTASTGRPKKLKSKPPWVAPADKDVATPSISESSTSHDLRSVEENDQDHKPDLTQMAAMPEEVDEFDSDSSSISSLSSASSLSDLEGLKSIGTVESTDSKSTKRSDPPSPTLPSAPAKPASVPLPSQYTTHRAYKHALKAYLLDRKSYGKSLRAYHKELYLYRKAEAHRARADRKASINAAVSNLNSAVSDLVKVSSQISGDPRKDYEVKRENRKREYDLRREQLRNLASAERDRIRTVNESWREECKRHKKAGKQHKKDLKRDTRAQKHGKGACSSRSRDDVTEDGDATEVEDSYFRRLPVPTASHAASSGTMAGPPLTANGYPEEKRGTPLSTVASSQSGLSSHDPSKPSKVPKDRKFCMLPPKDSTGLRDPVWQRIFMEGVDEVGAHCGLFFPQDTTASSEQDGSTWGERYARLVGDVAERIEGWVHEEMTERIVAGVQDLQVQQ